MFQSYYIAKIIRQFLIPSFNHCEIDKTVRVAPGCALAKVKMGRYSYVGGNTRITDAVIGNFCSIGGGCGIGGGMHPMGNVSTSPVFLNGRNILRKNFADIDYLPSETVKIEHDVWIGEGVYIKAGVSIGTGSVIGAHSVVVHDVEPYTIIAGIPAKEIRKRFDEKTRNQLLQIEWWNWTDEKLKKYGKEFITPERLINAIKEME